MEVRSSGDGGGGRYPRLRRDEREAEFARVLAFSDGVFAIAITLLVLQLEVPEWSSSSRCPWRWSVRSPRW